MKYKVGICQFEPKLLQPEKNLNKMKSMLKDINADLIVLPELATSGYVFANQEEVNNIAEDAQTGVTAKMFLELAKKNSCNYVVGIAEKSGEKIYNSALLIHKNGKIDVYRKLHLFYEEKKWFDKGENELPVFVTDDEVKIGVMICFDWIFPEAARTLALKGAQIIAHPSNLVLPWCQQAMITRSLENRVFSITCNRVGTEENGERKQTFTGMSQILSEKGEILSRLDKSSETLEIVEIDTEKANNKMVTEYNHVFADRRSDYYEL